MAETPTKPTTLALKLDPNETLCLLLMLGLAFDQGFMAPPVKSDALESHNALKGKYRAACKGVKGNALPKTAEPLTEIEVRYLQGRYKETHWPASHTEAAQALGKLLDVLAPRFADVEKAKEQARNPKK